MSAESPLYDTLGLMKSGLFCRLLDRGRRNCANGRWQKGVWPLPRGGRERLPAINVTTADKSLYYPTLRYGQSRIPPYRRASYGMGFVKLNGGSITADEEFIEVLVALKLDTMPGAFECSEGYMRTHGKHDNLHLAGKVGSRYYDLFMKRHRGWELSESIKLLMARSPSESAGRREWNNIIRLEEMGIPTMRPVAVGEKKGRLFGKHSFVVTERIPNATQMDHYAKEHWAGVLSREELREKRSLLWDVGDLARRLHAAGLTHMDLYLNHFFVRETPDGDKALHLIDLQRVGKRWLFPRRWVVKDLSAILYSARHLPLSRTDIARIFTAYFDGSGDARGNRLMKAAIARCERMMAKLDSR